MDYSATFTESQQAAFVESQAVFVESQVVALSQQDGASTVVVSVAAADSVFAALLPHAENETAANAANTNTNFFIFLLFYKLMKIVLNNTLQI